jgi:hypothetical protein
MTTVGSAVYRYGPQIWIFDFAAGLPPGEKIAEVVSASVVKIGPQGGGAVASSGGLTASPSTTRPFQAADFVIVLAGSQPDMVVRVTVLVAWNFVYVIDGNGHFVIDGNGNYVTAGRNNPPFQSPLTMVGYLQNAPVLPVVFP